MVVIPNSTEEEILALQDRIHVHIVSEIHHSVATLYKGLLLEEQHCTSIDREIKLTIDNHTFKRNKESSHIVTAVYNISLAGDEGDGFSEMVTMETTVSISCGVLVREARREEVLKFGATLVEEQVGLVLCQKCVHPSLREYLEQNVSH